MRGAAVVGEDALCLVHRELGVEEHGIVVVVKVCISACAVELLAHVVTAIEFTSVFQRSHGKLLDVVHGQVEINPVGSVLHVAVVFHFVGLVVVAARVVHHHDECAVEFFAHHFLIE